MGANSPKIMAKVICIRGAKSGEIPHAKKRLREHSAPKTSHRLTPIEVFPKRAEGLSQQLLQPNDATVASSDIVIHF